MRKKGANILKLTEEQLKLRQEILAKKPRKKKWQKEIKPVPRQTIFDKKLYYMNNCIYWITAFNEGRTDRKQLLDALRSLRILSQELETYILQLPQPPTT